MTNFKGYFYNTFDFYREAGVFTWTKPSDIDDSKPILVHVWGAGGTGHDAYYNTNTYCNGGGGGGYSGGGGSNTRVGSGGGGGNYWSGVYSSSGLNTGHGYVSIDKM